MGPDTATGMYEPHWTRLPEAAHTCNELVSGKCKKCCVKSCKCKKAALEFTALCACVRASCVRACVCSWPLEGTVTLTMVTYERYRTFCVGYAYVC